MARTVSGTTGRKKLFTYCPTELRVRIYEIQQCNWRIKLLVCSGRDRALFINALDLQITLFVTMKTIYSTIIAWLEVYLDPPYC